MLQYRQVLPHHWLDELCGVCFCWRKAEPAMVTPQTTWKHHVKLLETRRTSQYHLPSSSEEQPWRSSHCDDRDNPAACGTGRRSQSSPGSTRVPNCTFKKPTDFQDRGMVQSTHFQEGGAAFLASACIWSHLGLWKQSTLGHSFEKLNNYLTACFQREF